MTNTLFKIADILKEKADQYALTISPNRYCLAGKPTFRQARRALCEMSGFGRDRPLIPKRSCVNSTSRS
jgi:hypothetical protein